MHCAGGDAAPSRMSRRPPRCTHPVCTAQRGKGGVPTASHHHGYCQRTPQAAHGHYLARKDMAATSGRSRRGTRVGCSLGRFTVITARIFLESACAASTVVERVGQVGRWRRWGSEISTCACPHGPGAAASSDRTAMKGGFEQRSASRAPRAHHFCHRLHLRPETMVRPTRAARAVDNQSLCSH